MDIEINTQRIHLDTQQLLGSGGEGNVFLIQLDGRSVAVKIYHTPTPQRERKLRALLKHRWQLPLEKVAFPLQEVRTPGKDQLIGFTMLYLLAPSQAGTPQQTFELATLANRRQRSKLGISTRDVAELFLDGARTLESLHSQGLVVGDLSDQNVFCRNGKMLWIDTDAWQFMSYPCPVGTEDFLAPELYDLDLSLRPVFQPEHDWYSFAVLLFRALLLVHPYGGTHPTLPTVMQRARHSVFVLDASVIYPRMAYPPELLSNELRTVFERIFSQRWRGPFPQTLLQQYHDTLITCPTCQISYPQERTNCPLCHARSSVQFTRSDQAGILATQLLHTSGKFVFCTVQGETIYAIANEGGQMVLWIKRQGVTPNRLELFQTLPGTTYALSGSILLVNPPQTTRIFLLDISGSRAQPLEEQKTALFAGTREAAFQTSQDQIFVIQNGALLAGSWQDDVWQARPMRSVIEKQTWFRAAQRTEDTRPTLFGAFQVLHQQMYWLVRDHSVYDVALSDLDETETLQDVAVYFSSNDILVRRLTRQQGSEYLRTEILDMQGQITFRAPKLRRSEHPQPGLHGLVYQSGTLLHATDSGIRQEKVTGNSFKTFTATAPYVHEGDILARYGSGILVTGEDAITYLVL